MAIVQAFLLIEQPRQRLGHWSQALAGLDSPDAPPLAAIHAYYDATSDQALVELHYDDLALGEGQLAFVIDVALRAEVGMIQPQAFSDGERSRFLGERLARCKLQVSHQRNVVGALVELVKRIKELRTSQKAPPPTPSLARGTREDLADVAGNARAASPRPGSEPPVRPGSEERRLAAISISKHVVPRASRARTVEMEPLDARRLLAMVAGSDTVDALAHDTIRARYLRSGKWIPTRIGALSLRGAALMTGALPRLQDRVEVALTFAAHRAIVRGAVAKLSTPGETTATGTSTFSVKFDLDPDSRHALTGLLKAARTARVTIKPPPPRATRRFPVEWPVCLSSPRGIVQADALDISMAGMFVRPALPLERNAVLEMSTVLDDGGSAISGRVKVVRHIGADLAKQCGLAAGFGVALLEMSDVDRARWQLFVGRVERRGEKRVLVGALPSRFAELQAALAACGYAVTGGADRGAIVQLASGDARPADAALLDAAWLSDEASTTALERLFTSRQVPFVKLQGDARRARSAIDRLLAVG
jgi:hypothetical protein